MKIDKEAAGFARDLIDFIDRGPTQYHVASHTSDILQARGFEKLSPGEKWSLRPGGSYFMPMGQSGIIAFRAGSSLPWEGGFRIMGAHTDTPGFKIKPSPLMKGEGNSARLNTEVYGGPIYSTWFDRPLAIAGRVVVREPGTSEVRSILVDSVRPVAIIQNLSFHMNREVNKGVEINPQTDTLPLVMAAGVCDGEVDFQGYIASLANVEANDILGYDLYLHEAAGGCVMGINEELISSGRLDDLSSVHAGLNALLKDDGVREHWSVLALFDSEEIGSETPWGAGSPNLAWLLERCCLAMGGDRESFMISMARSFMVSADSAHGIHGAKPDRHDPTSRPVLNGGPVIKSSAGMKYTTTGETGALFRQFCEDSQVPFQVFVNRSDLKGGSTIGPIVSGHLPIRAIDIGTPLLGMHSIRELGGVMDHYWLFRAMMKFFN